jgi:alcohol dehydrogenase
MENFRFKNTVEIIFGKGTENMVGKETRKYSGKILLHYGGQTIKKIGLYGKIIKSLRKEGINFIEFAGVKPNPVLGLVEEGAEICRKNSIDFILAVGGGSVIDSAKAISIGALYDGDVWDFFTGKAKPAAALGIGVVLTVPAAGSESSVVTVISNEETQLKKGFHSSLMLPKFAILNPEITYSIDHFQTACGAADTIAHILERYFTPTTKADLTDRLCECAIRSVVDNVAIVMKNPEDYDARAELMWASTVAHNGILGTGRIEDWASHKLAHELSVLYGITHGAALSVIFPAWMKYVYRHNVKRFFQFAVRVWDVDPCFGTQEEVAVKGIEQFEDFLKGLGLPTRLKELEIAEDADFAVMAEKELQWGLLGNFVKLNKDDIVNIYKIAL